MLTRDKTSFTAGNGTRFPKRPHYFQPLVKPVAPVLCETQKCKIVANCARKVLPNFDKYFVKFTDCQKRFTLLEREHLVSLTYCFSF